MRYKLPLIVALACIGTVACVPPPQPPPDPCVINAQAGATSVDLSRRCKTGIPGLSTGSPAALQLNSSDGVDLRVTGGALPEGTTLSPTGALTGTPTSPGLWAARLTSSPGVHHRVWGWVSEPDPNWDDTGLTLLDAPPTDTFLVGGASFGRISSDGTLGPAERLDLLAPGLSPIDGGLLQRSLDSGTLVTLDPRSAPSSNCDLSVIDLTDPAMGKLASIPEPTDPAIVRCEVAVSADMSTVVIRRTGGECFRRGVAFIDIQFFDVKDLRVGIVDPTTVPVGECTGHLLSGAVSADGQTYVHNYVFDRFGPICEIWTVERSAPSVAKANCLRDNGDGTLTTLVPLAAGVDRIADLAPNGLLATQSELIQWVQPPGDEGHVVRLSIGLGWVDPSDGSLDEVVSGLPLEVFPLRSSADGFVSAVDIANAVGSVFDLGNGGERTDVVSSTGGFAILFPTR